MHVCRCACSLFAAGVALGDPPLRERTPSTWAESQSRPAIVHERSFVKALIPRRRRGCQLLSAGTPSYIHVTCQYVIEDKVLQPGFSFTKISSCCALCVCVSVCVKKEKVTK